MKDQKKSNEKKHGALMVKNEGDASAVQLVNEIIDHAIEKRASDIHVEPCQEDLKVRFRIDGLLYEIMVLAKDIMLTLISRIKVLSQMDIAEKRVPQDGRMQISFQDRVIDIRVSTLPTVFGEKVVMRLLDKQGQLLTIEQLGFNPLNLKRFQQLICHKHGIILFVGSTGSGKTTSLYAVINYLNKIEQNLVTIEDPVEYIIPGINQTQVNTKAGYTFANGLRSILRQDPDIIILGEIRDAESADIAVKAAISGHLVFSTLHTHDAACTMGRLVDMGIEAYLVSSAVMGVVCQRLVRVLCPYCKEAYVLPRYGEKRAFLQLSPAQPLVLYGPKGCVHCNYLGYQGRTAIQEILPVSKTIRTLVKHGGTEQDILRQAQKEGMQTLEQDGIATVSYTHLTRGSGGRCWYQ